MRAKIGAGSEVTNFVCTNASRYVHVHIKSLESLALNRLQCRQPGSDLVQWQPPMSDNRTSISFHGFS